MIGAGETPKVKFDNYWKTKCASDDQDVLDRCTDAANLVWEQSATLCGENEDCIGKLTATPVQAYTGAEMSTASAEFKAACAKLRRVEKGENAKNVFNAKASADTSAYAAAPMITPTLIPANGGGAASNVELRDPFSISEAEYSRMVAADKKVPNAAGLNRPVVGPEAAAAAAYVSAHPKERAVPVTTLTDPFGDEYIGASGKNRETSTRRRRKQDRTR